MRPLDPNLAAMNERNDNSPVHRRLLAKVATTIAAWAVAFLVVTALLSLFGDQLAALPLAARALIMSGVLVTFMVNLAMPVVGVGIGRLLAGRPPRGGSLTDRARGGARIRPQQHDVPDRRRRRDRDRLDRRRLANGRVRGRAWRRSARPDGGIPGGLPRVHCLRGARVAGSACVAGAPGGEVG
jgi:hypothetical protein